VRGLDDGLNSLRELLQLPAEHVEFLLLGDADAGKVYRTASTSSFNPSRTISA
jgi:hypothetical protein